MYMQYVKPYGNLVFVGGENPGLMVVDVSDRAHPKVIGGLGLGGGCVGVDIMGSLLVAGSIRQGVFLYGLRPDGLPVFKGRYASSGQPRSLVLSGNLAYVSNNGDLDVVDMSNPENPVWRGWYMSSDWQRGAPQPALILGSVVLCVDRKGYLLALQYTGPPPA